MARRAPPKSWVYRAGVERLDLAGSSARSVILMLLVIAHTVLQFRYVERRLQYT